MASQGADPCPAVVAPLPPAQQRAHWLQCGTLAATDGPREQSVESDGAVELLRRRGHRKGLDCEDLEYPRSHGGLVQFGPIQSGRRQPLMHNTRGYITTRKLKADCRFEPIVLGIGISGQVRVAACKQTGRRFAVKTFRRGTLSELGWAAAQREARIHLSVDHPNVARAERAYDEGNTLHLLMECLDGGKVLSRFTSQGKFPASAAAAVTREVLQALAYLHAHGIVHCDIKMENLLFERKHSEHVKLIDFGCAQHWDGRGGLSRECGTQRYMAPEIRTRSYTEKADLWSVGALLYMLLAGRKLPHSARLKETAGPSDYMPGLADLPEGARSLISSLLALDPAERPSAHLASKHPWLHDHASPLGGTELTLSDVIREVANKPYEQQSCMLAIAGTLHPKDQATARRQFHAWDRDGDGVISLDDLMQILGQDLSTEAEEISCFLGANGNGEVTWSRFLAAMLPREAEPHKEAASRNDGVLDGGHGGERGRTAAGPAGVCSRSLGCERALLCTRQVCSRKAPAAELLDFHRTLCFSAGLHCPA